MSFLLARHTLSAALVALVLATASAPAATDPVAMAIELLASDDADFRAIGLDAIRHAARGAAATATFAKLLEQEPPARQVELVRALADRGDAAALPALVALLDRAREPAVRTAALAAVGAIGSGDEVPVLLKSLAAGDPERTTARRALAALRGTDAVGRIVAALKAGDAALRPVLIETLGNRRARTVLPDIAPFATDPDAEVRRAALRVLGSLGGAAQVPTMIDASLALAPGDERREAERALVTVCTRNAGRDEAAQVFLKTFQAAPENDQETLLPVLGAIGGGPALAIVDAMIASDDPGKRTLGLKALTRWPDATVAQRLLDRIGVTRDQAERDLLLGALIRIAPLPDNKLDDAGKLDLVKRTMALCETDADRARLLERASAIRTVETFRFVVAYLDQPALAPAACKSVVELAHHRHLRDAHKAEFLAALDRVIAATRNTELVERAGRYKEGKTWERKR
jgi:HEAT repeat protein